MMKEKYTAHKYLFMPGVEVQCGAVSLKMRLSNPTCT